MKKMIVLAVLVVAVTGFAAAGGLVFHLGAGYHSSYIGDLPSNANATMETAKNMPLGIGGYVGLGYGFGENKKISIGGEFAPSWDFSLNPVGVSNFAYQGRAFLKFKPVSLLTLTGFGGFSGDIIAAAGEKTIHDLNPVIGGRVTVLFLYAEYDAVLNTDTSGILKHEVGLGFVFSK